MSAPNRGVPSFSPNVKEILTEFLGALCSDPFPTLGVFRVNQYVGKTLSLLPL